MVAPENSPGAAGGSQGDRFNDFGLAAVRVRFRPFAAFCVSCQSDVARNVARSDPTFVDAYGDGDGRR